MKKPGFKKSDLNNPVTLGVLLEFTDDFLLPKMTEIINHTVNEVMDKKNAELEYKLKTYIDNKLAEYTSDIFKRLDKKYQKDLEFKKGVVALLKKHKIGSAEEIAYLAGLAQ